MRWSKVKQRIEAGFAPSVQGRVEVWQTRYHRAHDSDGEGWITLDGRNIATFGDRSWQSLSYNLICEHDLTSNEAREIADLFSPSRNHFVEMLFDYFEHAGR